MDRVARELKLDRAEVRRRNFIPAEQMPYKVAHGARRPPVHLRQRRLSAVAGDARWTHAGYGRFRDAPGRSARAGRYIGIGIANAVEGTGPGPYRRRDRARLRPPARSRSITGATPQGPVAQDDARADRGRPVRRATSMTSPWCTADTAGDSARGRHVCRRALPSTPVRRCTSLRSRSRRRRRRSLPACWRSPRPISSSTRDRRGARGAGMRKSLREIAVKSIGMPGLAGYGRRPRSRARCHRRTSRPTSRPTPTARHVRRSRGRHRDRHGACAATTSSLHDCGRVINPMVVEGQMRRRRRARHRQRAVRVDGLRRRRAAADHQSRRVPAADRHRHAAHATFITGDALAAQSARGQGRRRGRHHPDRRARSSARSRTRLQPFSVRIAQTPISPHKLVELIHGGNGSAGH